MICECLKLAGTFSRDHQFLTALACPCHDLCTCARTPLSASPWDCKPGRNLFSVPELSCISKMNTNFIWWIHPTQDFNYLKEICVILTQGYVYSFWKEGNRERESVRSISCPPWSNLQLRYVSWSEMETTIFRYAGRHSNPLRHTNQGKILTLLKTDVRLGHFLY